MRPSFLPACVFHSLTHRGDNGPAIGRLELTSGCPLGGIIGRICSTTRSATGQADYPWPGLRRSRVPAAVLVDDATPTLLSFLQQSRWSESR